MTKRKKAVLLLAIWNIILAGKGVAQTPVPWPLPPFQSAHHITGTVGEYRPSNSNHPDGRFHWGVDMTNGTNYDVHAIEGGTVQLIQLSAAQNNYVVVNGNSGLIYYFHVDAMGISVGSQVVTGQKIGEMATQGAIHLHLQEQGENYLDQRLTPFVDNTPPGIDAYSFRENGHRLDLTPTDKYDNTVNLNGVSHAVIGNKVDIVVNAEDSRLNSFGNDPGVGGVAPYRFSYEILDPQNSSVSGGPIQNIVFNQYPNNGQTKFVFGPGTTFSPANYNWILTSHPFQTPYDRYWNTRQRVGTTEDWSLSGQLDAQINEEAKYPDGVYTVKLIAADIDFAGNANESVENAKVVIDNFQPYIKEVEILSNNQTYKSEWNWTGGTNNFLPINALVDDAYPLTITIKASEPLSQLVISSNTNIFSPTSLTSTDGIVWNYSLTSAQLQSVQNCLVDLRFTGQDLGGNSLLTDPSQIPVRLNKNTWSLNAITGTDAHHVISLAGNCGNPPSCTDNFEPNNTLTGAATIGASLGVNIQNISIAGLIEQATDKDYFSLSLNTSGLLTLDLTTLPADYDLELLNASGNLLLPISNNGGTNAEQVVYPYPGTSPTTVYAKVSGKNGAFDPCSNYTLTANWFPGNGCQDTYEPNPTASQAANPFPVFFQTPITPSLDSYIGSSTDQDVYLLGFDGMGTLTVNLTNLPANYELELLDFSGTTILANSSNPGQQNEQIVFPYNTPASTIRYLRVRGVVGAFDDCQPYSLGVNWTPSTGCVDNYEPNGSAATANSFFPPLTLTPYNGNLNSAIFAAGDEDYFAVSITTPGTITAMLSNLPTNYDLFWIGTNGTTVLNSSTQAGTTNEQINFTKIGSTVETYFLRIEGNGSAAAPCNPYTLGLVWNPAGGCIPPQLPQPLSPGTLLGPGTILNSLTPTFDWTTDPNATNYELAISIYPYGTNNLVFDSCLSSPPFVLPAGVLTQGQKYRWDVQANVNCGTCESPISYERYFQTQQAIQSYCSGPTSLTAPGGVFYDGSGSNLYQNNADCHWLIQPNGATSISLSFLFFDTEVGADFVTIYDGSSTTDPVLGQYAGDNLPPTIQSTGGEMLVHFTSNGSVQDWGWFATYQARFEGIVAYEYWFDQDYADKVSAYPGTIGDFMLNTAITTPSLSPGLHTFHIRFLDDLGHWSSVLSQYFHKIPVSNGGSNQIKSLEYWIDTDYNNRVSLSQSPQTTFDWNAQLDLTTLSPGLHTLHTRFLDDLGQWSSVLSQYFNKLPVDNSGQRNILAYEYWMDDDYANKIAVNQPPQPILELDTLLNVAGLTRGLHTFHIRFLDDGGSWSSVLSQYFHKIGKPGLPLPNLVVGYRYWFDMADTAMVYQSLNTPVNPLNLMVDIDATDLMVGSHRVHFQFLDTMQYWSSVLTDTFYRAALVVPTASFLAPVSPACVGTALNFTNTSTNANAYLWEFGDGATSAQTQATHTYQIPGNYTVRLIARDSTTGFADTLIQANSLQIISPPQLLSLKSDTICIGESLSLTTSGANTYTWSPSTGLSSTIGSAVVASPTNTTTYTVTGNNQCGSDNKSVLITVDDLQLTLVGTDPTCGFSNGSISAAVVGGIGALAYSWSNGQTTPSLSAVGPGQYTGTVTDLQGCVDSSGLTLINIPGPILTASVQNPTCSQMNGSIGMTVIGGTLPISYSWNTGSTQSSLTNLSTGVYTVFATDTNGCSDTSSHFLVNIPGPNLTGNTIDASCDSINGAVSVLVSGGAMPYVYSWDTGDSTDNVVGLGAGTYQVWVTDANSCVDSLTLQVNHLGAPTLSLMTVPTSCNAVADGTASAFVTGGTSPYHYSWSTGDTTLNVNQLSAGIYSFTVLDGNNCQTTDTISVNAPSALQLNISELQSVACYGETNAVLLASAMGGNGSYQFDWNNGTLQDTLAQIGAGTYQVNLVDSNGCQDSLSYNLNQPDSLELQFLLTELSCHNGSDGTVQSNALGGTGSLHFLWSTGDTTPMMTGLTAGTYTLTITDANHCQHTDSLELGNPLPLGLDLGPDLQGCDSIVLSTGLSGVQYQWSTGNTTENIVADSSGIYTVTVMDSLNCRESDTIGVTLFSSPSAAFTFSIDTLTAQFKVGDSTNVSSYSWSLGDGSSSSLASPIHSYADTGTYFVTLIVQGVNCGPDTLTQVIQISQTVSLGPFIPQAQIMIFPNPADESVLVKVAGIPTSQVKVGLYDMMGKRVYLNELLLRKGQGHLRIPLGSLGNGIYGVRIFTSQNQYIEKLKVQH